MYFAGLTLDCWDMIKVSALVKRVYKSGVFCWVNTRYCRGYDQNGCTLVKRVQMYLAGLTPATVGDMIKVSTLVKRVSKSGVFSWVNTSHCWGYDQSECTLVNRVYKSGDTIKVSAHWSNMCIKVVYLAGLTPSTVGDTIKVGTHWSNVYESGVFSLCQILLGVTSPNRQFLWFGLVGITKCIEFE